MGLDLELIDLTKKRGFQVSFESLQRSLFADFSWESVPESGGCHTESSVTEGLKFVVRDGELVCA